MEHPPLRSGPALAGADRRRHGLPLPLEAEDGLLTAEDETAPRLHATCDTGMGSARAGEGVFGPRRAFVVAGVHTLVIRPWSIPDARTRERMEHFYRPLREGAPRADALREARLAARERHPNPWFRSTFTCQGDPGPFPAVLLPWRGR